MTGNSMTAPKVFVTQFTKRQNFTELNEYGEVVFLTDKEYRPEPNLPTHNEAIRIEIKSKMTDYVPGLDYIVTTGSAIPNILAGMMIARQPGPHNVLKFNNMTKRFELFKV